MTGLSTRDLPTPSRWLVAGVALMGATTAAAWAVGYKAVQKTAAGDADAGAYIAAFDVAVWAAQVTAVVVVGGFVVGWLLQWRKDRCDVISTLALRPAAQRVLRACTAAAVCLVYVAVLAPQLVVAAPAGVLAVWAVLFAAALAVVLFLVGRANRAAAEGLTRG